MSVTLETVAKLADALPGAVVGARWGDLKRYGEESPPTGEIFAVIVDGLDAKDALLGIGLPGFFTIPHFNGYAAVLIELRLARLADVRAALEVAHRVTAARPPKRPLSRRR